MKYRGLQRSTVEIGFALPLAVTLGLGSSALAEPVPLGTEFQVNTYTTEMQRFPAVAVDDGRAFVVVWGSSPGQDGSGYGIFGQRYSSAGEVEGTEFQVNTYTTGEQFFPAVDGPGDGSFVVVWASDAPAGVFGQRYDSAGMALGTEFQVNSSSGVDAAFPRVFAAQDGSFVVVWNSLDLGRPFPDDDVRGQRYGSAGTPLGSEFRVNTYTTDFQGRAEITGSDDGSFVVVWTSAGQDGDGSGVFAQRYDSAGAPAGTEFQVNTYTTDGQAVTGVAATGDGSFMVVWNSNNQDGDLSGVFGQRYASTGGPLGTEFQVNTITTGFQADADVAATPEGQFVVVWSGGAYGMLTLGDDQTGIFARCYDSGGIPRGTEFLVNTYTTAMQTLSRVATTDGDGFVIVWNSFRQDGSLYGIFGQRYGVAASPTPTSTPTRVPTGTPTRTSTATPTATAKPCVAGVPSSPAVTGTGSNRGDAWSNLKNKANAICDGFCGARNRACTSRVCRRNGTAQTDGTPAKNCTPAGGELSCTANITKCPCKCKP